jgi:Ca2+-binding RTX toxin-like protein
LDKSNVLYSDGVIDGVVTYSGTDAELAAEIAWYNDAANGHSLKEDASGYAYWEHTVALPDGSGETKTQNYLLKSSDLWGPGYDETIQPGMYPEDRKDEFSFTAAVGSFAEDYEFVEGYGDLDFYNGIDSYIPALGKSEYHYVTTFSSDLADEDRLEGVAFPYVLGIQYKGEVDEFNSDGQTRIDFLADTNNGLETVYDLGITGKDDSGNPIASSVIDTWESEQTATPEMPAGMGAAPVDGTITDATTTDVATADATAVDAAMTDVVTADVMTDATTTNVVTADDATTDVVMTDATTADVLTAVDCSSVDGSGTTLGTNSNDNLTGGNGGDVLVGGNGLDTLTGGNGADRFTFNSLTEAADVITDFSVTDDLIDLRGVLSGSTAASVDKFTQFVQLVQVGANTEVRIDTDLEGAGATFTQLVTLNNVAIASLSAAQFVTA